MSGLKVDTRFLDLSAYYTALQTDALLAGITGGSSLTNYYTKTQTDALLANKQNVLSGTGIVKSVAGTISYLTDNSTNWDSAYTNRITSLTTTGSSGAATLISNVLNIPTYTLAGLGGQPQLSGTGFVKISGTTISYDSSTYLTGNQTITLSGDISGSGSTAITTTIGSGVVTNAMLAGSIDLTTKVTGTLPVANGGTGLTSLTAGYIPFGNGTSAFGSSANLYWDDTNSRLRIGNINPTYDLHIEKTVNGGVGLAVINQSNGSAAAATVTIGRSLGADYYSYLYYASENNGILTPLALHINTAAGSTGGMFLNNIASAPIYFKTANTTRLTIGSTGIVTVANTTASTSSTTGALIVSGGLGVAGAGYFGGALTLGSAIGYAKFNIKSSDQTYLGGLHIMNSANSNTWSCVNDSNSDLNFGYATNPSSSSNFTQRAILNTNGRFNLNSSITSDAIISLRSVLTTIGNHSMIRFGDVTQTTNYQKGAIIYESVNSSSRGKLHLALENTDGSGSVALSDAKMTILSDGKVGIMTPSPSERLDLGTSANPIALKLTQTGVTEVYLENSGLRMKNIYSSGGWARGLFTYENTDGTDYFQLGAFGNGQSFTYGFIGPAYNDTFFKWYPDKTVTFDGNITIGSTTTSTSTTTGALIVSGGLGVGGAGYFGGTLSSSNLSGTNTGDQTITLTGAVTGSGTGSFATTLASAIVGISNLSATGTPSASTYLRGDNTWATPAGGSGITIGTTTITSGVDTKLLYNDGGLVGESAIYFDGTNTGFGTSSPQARIDIVGDNGVRFLLYGTGGTAQYLAGLGVNIGQGTNSMGFFTGQNSDFTVEQATAFENYPYTTGYTTRFVIARSTGHAGFNVISPTAAVHIKAGTTTVPPLKINSGSLVTTISGNVNDGALEYASSHLYFTIGSTRYQLDQQGGSLSDGDKGDITVSSSGSVWTIDSGVVTLAKMANMATASLIGRNTAGTGVPEVLSASTAKTLLSLNNVENTALSTWAGTTNITTLGTISTGTWSATTIAVNKGGTGQTSYAVGDLIYASASTTLAKLAAVATGNVLISGGVTTAPSWGKVGLTTHVSGTLPVSNGGIGITSAGGFGSLLVGGGSSSFNTLAGNTTTTKKYLTQTGDGVDSDDPVWESLETAGISWITYSDTATWSVGTAPSGSTNHEYRYWQIGKMVFGFIRLVYGTAGVGNTTLEMRTNSFPVISKPSNAANGEYLTASVGFFDTAESGTLSAARCWLEASSQTSGFIVKILQGSLNAKFAMCSFVYLTA